MLCLQIPDQPPDVAPLAPFQCAGVAPAGVAYCRGTAPRSCTAQTKKATERTASQMRIPVALDPQDLVQPVARPAATDPAHRQAARARTDVVGPIRLHENQRGSSCRWNIRHLMPASHVVDGASLEVTCVLRSGFPLSPATGSALCRNPPSNDSARVQPPHPRFLSGGSRSLAKSQPYGRTGPSLATPTAGEWTARLWLMSKGYACGGCYSPSQISDPVEQRWQPRWTRQHSLFTSAIRSGFSRTSRGSHITLLGRAVL